MPLSEKSKTSLRLMEEAEGTEEFSGEAVTRREPESPNAHLPFVLDVYGVRPAAKKTADVVAPEAHDAPVAEPSADAMDAPEAETDQQADAHAAAEDGEAQEALDQEAEQATASEDAMVEPDVDDVDMHAEEAADAASDLEHAAVDMHQALDEPQEAESEPEVNTVSEHDEPALEQDLAESELLSDDSAGEPQALGAEIDEVLEQEPVPAAAPVVVGIDPEEVAQREAAQFAQGLAQGIAQGESQAREAMQHEVAAQCAMLSSVTQDLNALLQDPKKFFEPMKRLALHVAEHVVMKELSTSTEAIERLVQRCLDELDHPAQGAVVVELNPEDKERLQAQNSALVAGMRLDAVKDMKPGSVRLFANDTVVEDLVEHRLEALARSLLVDVEDWRARSLFSQADADVSESQPESEVEDVEPNDVHP